ncbi:hypothetical protein K503DRAFT_430753 [Rhizopogon vinicolor AM-OR11-026]|uniref:Uncharacterized protein n=1 Tax=Rhizopogon vinicolor AM-OR11-026 TaxID=1314800 RepID=A0A1B7MPR6_9AGAM|nr:hypothetical protein K503DRAFT_430753 [Rhizopogon vinicolor AM-OR11-026]
MFCLHSHHLQWSSTASRPCGVRLSGRTAEVCPHLTNLFSYSASRVTPLSGPISPQTNYAFLPPCHYYCSGRVHVR